MRFAKAILLILALLLPPALGTTPAMAEVSLSFFYSNLSPHGDWLVSAEYGRVWQPAAYYPGWNPYYDGHWVYADVGWTWVSDYGWGSVPYHYGTWVLDPALGWVWVPGYVWAPSWVVFRTGPDYIGWAPVAPSFAVGAWFNTGSPGPFVFVASRDFMAPRIRRCVVPSYRTAVLIERTQVVNRISIENRIVVNRGPERSLVERATHRKIGEVPIDQIRQVSPERHFSREQLRVSSRSGWRSVRAAEPVSERTPAPSRLQKRPENYRQPPTRRQPETYRQPESRGPALRAPHPERMRGKSPTGSAPSAPGDRLRSGTGSSQTVRPDVRRKAPPAPAPKRKSQKPPKKQSEPPKSGSERSSGPERSHS